MSDLVRYRTGYKYQLAEEYHTTIPITPPQRITHSFFSLTPTGELTVEAAYAFDGPSGPTIDSVTSIRASLEHDVLYQAMRERLLGEEWRAIADTHFYARLRQDGMWRVRAWCWYQGVRWGAGPSARPSGGKPVLIAP